MAVKQETELYPSVKAFFTGRGYEVKAEIVGCDLVAYHPEQAEPTIIEMKRIFTLPLLLQGIDRQKTGASVWLAVERNRTKKGAHNQRFNEITALCRRLQLGFMTVTFYKTKAPVTEVWCEPTSYGSTQFKIADSQSVYLTAPPKKQKSRATKLLKEFDARSGDYNIGGSSKRKLMTAYRERAMQCALALACDGPSAPRHVKERTGCLNTASLMRTNYYQWFNRIRPGFYELTPAGYQALIEYADVTQVWAAKFPWALDWEKRIQTNEGVT